MNNVAKSLFAFVLTLGGPGLLVVGILDSSFLFAPLGNDLLLVAMTVRHPSVQSILYYSTMSALGSVLGCLLVDLLMRPVGEQGLKKHLSPKRLNRVKSKVRNNAARALAIASIAPPPFPFTAFVMSAAALQYPRQRLLVTVGTARMVRFTFLGLLAWRFGEAILAWAQNPVVQGFLIALIILCTAGSVVSVYRWIKRSRSAPADRSE